MKYLPARVVVITLICLGLLACKREAPAPVAARTAPAATTAPPTAVASLADVVETTPDYMIGISYAPSAAKYPGLVTELQRYAEAARADLLEAVRARKAAAAGASPYDLSISFTELMDSPQLFAVAADGSSYTGGAHGAPLLARFVWLPQQGRLLTANDLVPDPKSWAPIAVYVREQLLTALSQRVDADDLPPAERLQVVRDASRMIEDGTEPSAETFAMFEPVAAPSGKLRALRFVFAPYQVGPYSDGTQTVEVPAAVLLPRVAPAYRSLFEAGAS